MRFFVRDGKRSAKKAFLIVISIMALVVQPMYGLVASHVANAISGITTYQELQDALDGGETIVDLANTTITIPANKTITVDHTVTFNGGILKADGAGVNGSTDAVVYVNGGNSGTVTFTANGTVFDGANKSQRQGVKAYYKANVVLNDVTIQNNSKYGLHVNGTSTATVTNITTKKNGGWYGGLAVSGGGAITIDGQSRHTDEGYGFYDARVDGSGTITDNNHQYDNVGNYYKLKPAPAAPVIATPTEGQVITTTTTNNTVNITWNTVPGAHSYIVTVDGVPTSVTATSHVLTSPANGAHTVTVQSVAQSGLLGGTSAVRNFTIDVDQLPQATIDVPAVNGYVRTKPGNKLHITGTFTDDRTANYLQLQLVGHNSGNPVGSFGFGSIWTTGGLFTYDLTVPASIEDGTYQLTYTPTDYDPVTGGGQVGAVGSVAFTIDNTAPQVSNISIAPRINGNTGGNSVTVYFDITDAAGVDLDKTYVMFADGPNIANQLKESVKVKPVLISGNSYKATFDSFQFVKANYVGNYNLQFTTEDVLGNRTSSKPLAFRNILVDNSGPSSVWTAPSNGGVISGVTRFSFDVSDDTDTLSGYVKFNGSTTKSYTLAHGIGNEWYADVPTSELTDGTYTVDARFVDVFNRPRYGANKGTVVVDNTAPTVSIVLDAAVNPTVAQIFAHDANLKRIDVSLRTDGDTTVLAFPGEWATAPDFDENYASLLGLSSLADGEYTIRATAADSVGHSTNAASVNFTVDHTAPIVTVDDIATIVSGEDANVTGTVDDLTVDTVEVFVDGVSKGTVAVTNGSFNFNLTGLTTGTYSVTVKAADAFGNESTSNAKTATVTALVVDDTDDDTDPDTDQATTPTTPIITARTSGGTVLTPIAVVDNNSTTTTDTDSTDDTDVLAATTTDSNKDGDTDGQVLAAEDTKGNWSVVNLVLAVVTIILSLVALLGLARKKDGTAARIMTLIPVAIAVTAFLMIENWTASMIWLNWWTVLYAVVLAVQVAIVSGLKNSAE